MGGGGGGGGWWEGVCREIIRTVISLSIHLNISRNSNTLRGRLCILSQNKFRLHQWIEKNRKIVTIYILWRLH